MRNSGRERRLGGAIGLSVVCHGILLLFLLVAVASRPREAPEIMRSELSPAIVWLAEPGPGGGGGGGGDERPDPPAAVQEAGDDGLTVPVEAPPAPEPEPDPEPPAEPDPDPVLRVHVPVRTMAAALTRAPGALLPGDASGAVGQGRGPGAGGGDGDGLGTGDGPGLGDGRDGGVGGGPRGAGSGVTAPVALLEVKPAYTAEALRAKIQGTVWVQCVVRPEGICTDLQVVRSLDTRFGLDDEAVRAARQWRFAPGRRGGEPVAVEILIQIDFALR